MRARAFAAGLVSLGALTAASVFAQRPDAFTEPFTHPAIEYPTRPTRDPVALLNRELDRGAVTLTFDAANGYLGSVLTAMRIPVASQLLVFSQTSAQGEQVSQKNPRALFFRDELAVGWVRHADLLELASVDPEQGVIFYTLEQRPMEKPQFRRDNGCLLCHAIWETHGVPGLQTLSTFPMPDENAYAAGLVSDHRTPFADRWGGWFVTGNEVPALHLGNRPVVRAASRTPAPILRSLEGQFDPAGYPARTSDVVALMVLEHQSQVTNLITWLGWEARVARAPVSAGGSLARHDRVAYAARELADALLFVDEAPLTRPIAGNSGFTEWFSAQGKKDRNGRSLRQFDLRRRLFLYPCSYLIDSAAFNALPASARLAVFDRLSEILSGADAGVAYERLTQTDRQNIIDILKGTRQDLPPGFGARP